MVLRAAFLLVARALSIKNKQLAESYRIDPSGNYSTPLTGLASLSANMSSLHFRVTMPCRLAFPFGITRRAPRDGQGRVRGATAGRRDH